MKKIPLLFLVPVFLISCTSSSSDSTASAAKDSVAAVVVNLPYTASYSSNFVPGKPADVLTTLNNYKAWETADMAAFRATLADSSTLILPSGRVITGKSDSLVKGAKQFRDSLSKVELDVVAWTSIHSVDKNEDWVSVWYKETDTYKTGKVDSANYQDDNRLQDGKIVLTSSHRQALPK
jgi:ketosteroid isomerase-like protein